MNIQSETHILHKLKWIHEYSIYEKIISRIVLFIYLIIWKHLKR